MGFYQRLGVFLVRVIGLYQAMIGILGFLDYLVIRLQALPNSSERLGASFSWTLGGCIVLALSKPLGGILGQGLDNEKVFISSDDI